MTHLTTEAIQRAIMQNSNKLSVEIRINENTIAK